MSKVDSKKKNIVLISIMVVLAIVTIWYVLRSRSPQGQGFSVDQLLNTEAVAPDSGNINLPSKDVFVHSMDEDQRFRQLKDSREPDLTTGKVGRDNPFEPFR